MIEKIIIAFLFLFLFLLVFLALHRVIKNTKWTCFVATAVSCLPFILLWEHRTNFLEWKSVNSPNVIILLVDCLRADHLRSYGYSRKTSPNIDRFAKDSVMFTQAISQSTFTKTSVASLFTSLYPYQHGVYEGNLSDTKAHITSDVLSEEKTTLSETLSQNGFLTMAWIKNEQMRSFSGVCTKVL
jgi:Arylsulfatase A and related enzymes